MKLSITVLIAFSMNFGLGNCLAFVLPPEQGSGKEPVKLLYERRLSSGPLARESDPLISEIIIADLFPNQGLALVAGDRKNLYLLDGATGNTLQSHEVGPITGVSHWALARLDADKSWKIIAGDSQGNLRIIDPYSRKVIGSATLGFDVFNIMVSDPHSDGVGRLGIIGRERGARKPYYFTVLDPKQMTPLWRKKGEGTIQASLFVRVGTTHLVVVNDENDTECYDVLSGKKLWSHNMGMTSFMGVKWPCWVETVALMRVDGGSKVQIVVGTACGGVFVYDSQGQKLGEANIGGSPLGNVGFIEKISTGDLTADGFPEIVISSIDHKVYALDGKTLKKLWEHKTGDEVYSSPALADMNNDGVLDVVVVPRDSRVYCINGRDGKLIWRYELSERAKDDALVADVNRDGYLEVVTGSLKSSTVTILTTNARCEKGVIPWGRTYGNHQNTGEYGVR